MDDPTFTQPLMYDVVENRPSVPDMYATELIVEYLFVAPSCSLSVNFA